MKGGAPAFFLLLILMAVTSALGGTASGAVGSAPSKHNMTDVQGYGFGGSVCASCHKPHSSSGKRIWTGDKEGLGDGLRDLVPAKAASRDQAAGGADYPGIYLCLDCHSDSSKAPAWSRKPGHEAKKVATHSTRELQAAGYATKYSSFVEQCTVCHDPHQYWDGAFGGGVNGYMIRASVKTPGGTYKAVVFSSMTGHNSFADGDSTKDGICEVCHTMTVHNTGKDCTVCHSHAGGFASYSSLLGCDGCHGNPPVGYGTLVGRAANPGRSPTGAATAGRHAFHDLSTAGGAGFECRVCHRAGMGDGEAADGEIDVRFEAFGVSTSGGFDGFTPISGYTFSAGNTTGGALTCRNTYCHGNFTGGKASNAPAWDNPSSGACGTCHDTAPPGLLNHSVHITAPWGPKAACDNCHPVNSPAGRHASHVDGDVDFKDGQALATTTVCNGCHGCTAETKPTWGITGYRSLTSWCEGCHDGSSTVNTMAGTGGADVSAPNVTGDKINYGYDVTGHGKTGTNLACIDCHNRKAGHIDGSSPTYRASMNNFKAAYRLTLSDVVPLLGNYTSSRFGLCYHCHIEARVVGMPAGGRASAQHVHTSPISVGQWYTNFRNTSTALGRDEGNWDSTGSDYDVPTNIHWNHLDDYGSSVRESTTIGKKLYDSDLDGTGDSYVVCGTCHDPHGTRQPAMVLEVFSIQTYSVTPAYRWLGSAAYNTTRCTYQCHSNGSSSGTAGTKWYREPTDLSSVFGVPIGLEASPLP